jgi:hypothetical protein
MPVKVPAWAYSVRKIFYTDGMEYFTRSGHKNRKLLYQSFGPCIPRTYRYGP